MERSRLCRNEGEEWQFGDEGNDVKVRVGGRLDVRDVSGLCRRHVAPEMLAQAQARMSIVHLQCIR